jgi:RNA:NAD 2'-phosphotransferase (TPT1/KptA family)
MRTFEASGLSSVRANPISENDPSRHLSEYWGVPVILGVAARAMWCDGWQFYRSGNDVWLVEHVPPRYLLRRPGV